MDGFDDAFSEWDENAPTAQLARGSRTALTTHRRLAKGSQQIAVPRRIPETLEEALLALTQELSEGH